jgi:hypothetical protein
VLGAETLRRAAAARRGKSVQVMVVGGRKKKQSAAAFLEGLGTKVAGSARVISSLLNHYVCIFRILS